MIEFRDTVYVATEERVYRLVGDEFHPLTFVSQPESAPVEADE